MYNNCLIGATLKFSTFSNFATKLRLFGSSGTKNNFIFELGMLENIFPDVLGIKVAKNVKKFENMKYRISDYASAPKPYIGPYTPTLIHVQNFSFEKIIFLEICASRTHERTVTNFSVRI